MPLSEHEQQILDDIEQRLTRDDPRFAETVSNTTLATHLARRLRWSILGFTAGLIMLMLFFVNLWIAAAGFALMVGCAFVFYLAIKRLGQEQLRISFPALVARFARRSMPEDDATD